MTSQNMASPPTVVIISPVPCLDPRGQRDTLESQERRNRAFETQEGGEPN